MKIKNTKLLRQRADWHHENDHIKQGTYGEGSVNGKPCFEGCAIGCLSTPHTFKALDTWARSYLPENYESGKVVELGPEPAEMRDILGDEFGICNRLTRLAEDIFERLPYHGDAINFVRDFAHALKEGSTITDHDVIRFESTIDYDRYSYEESAESFLNWLKAAGAPESVVA